MVVAADRPCHPIQGQIVEPGDGQWAILRVKIHGTQVSVDPGGACTAASTRTPDPPCANGSVAGTNQSDAVHVRVDLETVKQDVLMAGR
jgi:hypothetical protein